MTCARQIAAPKTHFHSMAQNPRESAALAVHGGLRGYSGQGASKAIAPARLTGIHSDWVACRCFRNTSQAPDRPARRRSCRRVRLRDVSVHIDPRCTRRWRGRTVPPRTVPRPQEDRDRLGTCSSPRRRKALGSRCTRKPPGRTARRAEGVCHIFPALRPRRCTLGRMRKEGRRNDKHRPRADRQRTSR